MILVDPKEDTLKFSCWYLYKKCVKKGGSRMGVLGGHWGFLTIDLEDRVILDIMDDLEERYPEIFLLIPLLEVCQEGGVKKEGTWRTLRVPDHRYGGQGHSWHHGWSWWTPRKIPWNFHVDIFIRSWSGVVRREWWYLKDVEGSWLETLWVVSKGTSMQFFFDSWLIDMQS